ncbi:hypothetical protein ACLOJK_022859, partial [Asimina triloba]
DGFGRDFERLWLDLASCPPDLGKWVFNCCFGDPSPSIAAATDGFVGEDAGAGEEVVVFKLHLAAMMIGMPAAIFAMPTYGDGVMLPIGGSPVLIFFTINCLPDQLLWLNFSVRLVEIARR